MAAAIHRLSSRAECEYEIERERERESSSTVGEKVLGISEGEGGVRYCTVGVIIVAFNGTRV